MIKALWDSIVTTLSIFGLCALIMVYCGIIIYICEKNAKLGVVLFLTTAFTALVIFDFLNKI